MDRRQIIRSYFTDRHLENNKLRSLYIETIVEEFGLLSDYAELIQLFGSVDDIPASFLEDLGDSIAYEYLQEEDPNIQREIIRRIIGVYKNRSGRKQIEDVLRYSTDRNWIGGNLTLYKGDLKEGYQNIWLPRDHIFYHDKSIHDGGDCFMDLLTYNFGIIGLEMQYFDERTTEMLEREVPGGVRWNISHLVWFPGDSQTGVPRYTKEFAGIDYLEDLTLMTNGVYVPRDIAYFDEVYDKVGDLKGLIANGGLLGKSDRVIVLNQGRLGDKPGKRIDLGRLGSPVDLSIYEQHDRSGIYVVSVDIEEDFSTETSYRSGTKVFSFNVDYDFWGIRKYDVNDHDDGTSRDGLNEPAVMLMARYRELTPYDFTYTLDGVVPLSTSDNADSQTRGFQVEEF